MNDMSELERRISAALDRISTHVTTLQRPVAPPVPEPEDEEAEKLPPASELMADLESERAVTAQLEERVRAIKERQDTKVAELETNLAAAQNRIAALEEENAALQEGAANNGGDDEADALRRALSDLRAEREAERAEIAALLAELQPIVEESARA